MGLFSSDSKNTTNSNTTNNTAAYNSALAGGDSSVGYGAVVAQHSDVNQFDYSDRSFNDSSKTDNSFYMATDTSGSDYSSTYTDKSNRSFNDSSDNSFKLNVDDHSDYSQQNQTSFSSSSNTNITDGGAFAMVNGVMKSMIDSFGVSSAKMIDLVGFNQKATLESNNQIAQRGIDATVAMQGAVVNDAVTASENMNLKTIGLIAAGVLGVSFVFVKMSRGSK